MRIGVPKETKVRELRVGMTPASAREYASAGHEVLVQAGAGAGIGADDSAYEAAGATIVASAQVVYARSEMIVKVKEPQPAELRLLQPGQILFAYLHLATDRTLTEGLLASGCIAVAYETVTDDAGGLPLLAPMSEVAGRLAVEVAAGCLRGPAGKGVLLGGVAGVLAARVVILGGGVVGTQAARMAAGLGAEVSVVERSLSRLRELDQLFQGRVRVCYSTAAVIEAEVGDADVVIGAALVPGASTPLLVTRAMLRRMRPRSVLIDVAIDQGGCFETSRPTTHDAPTHEVDGIIHYAVTNMPGAVPVTSSHALNHATLPFGLALAAQGERALRADRHLRNGLNIHRGKLTCEPVAKALQLQAVSAQALLV
ncbi:MAG TPA: alanine dehydrogenase [Burkholderiaceae bacterium]|nr:alanine dehydrogenase [Burkholderiaceae bacterium]